MPASSTTTHSVGTPRRYYLGKRIDAALVGDTALELAWAAKQEAQPGTALPTSFPYRTALAALGYTTTEDLTGADATELQFAGLTPSQADDVIAALE